MATLVSDIIRDSLRNSNLLSITEDPTDDQNTEGLRYLNRIVKSVFGFEAGEKLNPVIAGGKNVSRPSGYASGSEAILNDANWVVPTNTRLILNPQTGGVELFLHPKPDDGARFSVINPASNLSSFPVTVYGNGNTIQGGQSIVLNTDGFTGEWFYNEDSGNWSIYSPLALTDEFPFPSELDQYFIIQLAMSINPAYGASIDSQSMEMYRRAKKHLRAKYAQNKQVRSELALIRLEGDPRWRGALWYEDMAYSPDELFERGSIW